MSSCHVIVCHVIVGHVISLDLHLPFQQTTIIIIECFGNNMLE